VRAREKKKKKKFPLFLLFLKKKGIFLSRAIWHFYIALILSVLHPHVHRRVQQIKQIKKFPRAKKKKKNLKKQKKKISRLTRWSKTQYQPWGGLVQ
jgi:hypothetical protein